MAETNNEDHGGRERFPKLPDADAPKGADDQRVWNETLAQFSTAQKTLNAAEALMPPAHESRGELHEKRHPPSNDREYLKKISAEERLRMLSSQLGEGKELTPEQTLRIQEIDLVESFAEVMAASRSHDIPAVQAVYGGPLQWIRERRGDLVLLLVRHPDESLKNILPNHFLGLFEKMDISLDPALEPQEILARQNFLVKLARENRCYAVAEDVMNKALDEEFKQGERQISAAEKDKMRTDAKNTIDRELKRRHGEKEGWAEKGIDAQLIDRLTEREYQHSLHSEIASRFLGKTIQFTGEKAELWEQYRDMLDPHGELRNPKDSTWDTIRDELISNAPLILVSGGVASFMRAGVSLTAREFIIGKVGEAAFKKLAQKTAMKAAATVSGTLVEGAVFETVSKLLHGEWYKDLPDFAKSTLWSAATLGLFHGAGKLGERFFSKEVVVAGEKLMAKTALGNAVSHIKNPAVKEAAKQLIIKGHMEAATMLLVSAVQNGVYEGNLDEFFHNFGDEILHAYISVGALKIGGAVAKKAAKKMFGEGKETKPPRQSEAKEATPRSAFQRYAETVEQRFEVKKKELPKIPPNENDVLNLKEKIKSELTPQEQALPTALRNAVIRSRLYSKLAEISAKSGTVMSAMENYARENPEATPEQIIAEARKNGLDELPSEVQKKCQIGALQYERNRDLIKAAKENYTPAQIFEMVTGIKPLGKIHFLRHSPFSVQLLIEDVDIARIENKELASKTFEEIKERLSYEPPKAVGYKLTHVSNSEIQSLRGLTNVVVEDTEVSRRTYEAATHEETHTMNDVFFGRGERQEKVDRDSKFLRGYRMIKEASKKTNGSDVLTDLEKAFALLEEDFLVSAKDEIVAYMTNKSDQDRVGVTLLNKKGSYNYVHKIVDPLISTFPAEHAEIAQQARDRLEQRYTERVTKAVSIANELVGENPSSEARKRTLLRLISTPMERWESLFPKKTLQQHIEGQIDTSALRPEEKAAYIEREAKQFADTVREIEKIDSRYADSLLDFNTDYHPYTGEDINTWPLRKQYAERILADLLKNKPN